MSDSYKVTYRMFGSYHLYGYADTLAEAKTLDDKCADEGWLYRKISRYDEATGTWNEI